MAHQIPAKMKALIVQPNKTAKIEEVPVPTIDDDEVLVKTVAVGQNPTDWKHVHYINNPGTICGCEFSGHVVKVGKNVTSPAVGDLVASFVHGSKYKDRGAFAEFAKTPAELTWKVPDNITAEQAATLSLACFTGVQGFYHSGRLGLVEPPAKTTKQEWIFVSGGSSSVGMYAVQLARLSGYKVVTVASPKNHDLCRSLGADAVFDYKDKDVVNNVKQATNDSVQYAFDTVSTPESQLLSSKVIRPQGGKVLVILDPVEQARSDLEIIPTLLYTALGKEFEMGGKVFAASSDDRAELVRWLKKQPEYVKQGLIKPNPIKLIDGGLANIPAGFKYMMDDKVSAEKLVYRVSK